MTTASSANIFGTPSKWEVRKNGRAFYQHCSSACTCGLPDSRGDGVFFPISRISAWYFFFISFRCASLLSCSWDHRSSQSAKSVSLEVAYRSRKISCEKFLLRLPH